MDSKLQILQVSKLKPNDKNPRYIKDEAFSKLCNSISSFPEMMEIRPVVVNEQLTVLGGNMRLRAAKKVGLKEIPVLVVHNLTEAKQKEFIIKDNVSGGEWDLELLQAEWDVNVLDEWGLELPFFNEMPSDDELIGEEKNKPPTMKITFPTPDDLQKCEPEIQEVINRLCPKAFYSVSAGEI